MHERVTHDHSCCDCVPDFMPDVLISHRDIVGFLAAVGKEMD